MTFTSTIDDGTGAVPLGTTNDFVTEAGGMSTFNVGTYTITYTATDPCSQVSQYSFTLVIEDDTPPSLDCTLGTATIAAASPYTADPSGCETSIMYEAPLVMDNCAPPGAAPILTAVVLDQSGNLVTSIIVDQNAGGTPLMHAVELPVGNWQIQYTLTDGVGLMATCTIPVEVIDIQDPSISCGPNQTINSICPATTVPDYTGNATTSDNCGPGGITVTQDPPANTTLQTLANNNPAFSLADGQQFTVTLTATQNGTTLTDDCTFTVTIMDDDAPVPDLATLPTINSNTTLGSECGRFLLSPYTATNCDGTKVEGIPSTADGYIDTDNDNIPDTYVYNTGFHFVTWTYDDGNGNVATQGQSITIIDDSTNPIITFTNNPITRNTTTGKCHRNINLANFLTEVFPSTAPFSDPANQTFNRQYIDNCGVVLLEYEVTGATTIARTDFNGQSQLNKGSNMITFYATDAAGNEGTNTVEMIVEDNEDPVAAIPSNITLNLGDTNDADLTDCAYTILDGSLVDPTATDNCAMPPLRTLTNVSATLADGGTFSAPAPLVLGSLEGYTFTVANDMSAVFTADYEFNDGNGQTISKSITITVVDDRKPDITCPGNTTRDTDGNCEYVTNGTEFDLTAISDNCSSPTQLVVWNSVNHGSSLAGETFIQGTTTVTWTVTDLNGKVSSCEIDVIVEDNLEPTLNCVDINRNLLSNGTVTVNAFDFLTSYTDACDDGLNPNYYNISINQTFFDCDDATNTPIEVEITVVDLAGNIAICRPTITIQETVAPTANCLSVSRNLSATAPGMVTVTAAELNDGSVDNCTANTAGLVFSFTADVNNPMLSMDFDCDDTGVNSVNFYAIDVNGNVSAACPATITVVDNTNIDIQCQDLTRVLDVNGSVTVNASEFNNGSTDNCGSTSSLTYTLQGIGTSVTLGCNNIGSNNYVLEIFDGTNTSTCNVELTIVDQTGPVADCQPVMVNLTGAGTQVVNASMFDLNSMDLCSGATVSFEFADGSSTMTVDCNDLGTNPITITVRDNVGNPTTCTTTLTVGPENPAVFTAGTISAGTGATVDIDITVEDYFEMVSWQFSGDIDPSFATINSIISPLSGGIFQPQFDAVTGEFQMAYSEFPSVSLGDGSIVATINVTLISTVVGATSPVNLKDGTLSLEIAQGCSNAPQATEIDEATHLVDGQLTIANGQVTISGTIQNDQGTGVPNVDISITGDVSLSTTTDAAGAYSIVVPGGSTVTLTPTKDTKHKNGISALDAAIVQALANNSGSTTLIPSPTRRIAADPNTTQSISVADAGIISFVNVISGATFHNPPGYDVNSWVFVDGSHVFTNPLNPWNAPYNEVLTFTNVTTDQTNQDFTAIKIGDVTGDADVNMLSNNGDTRSSDLIFHLLDQTAEAGETISIPLKVQSFQDLIAFQATLNFNATALTFNNVTTDLLDQFGNVVMDLSQAEVGLLALSWYSGQTVNLEDQEKVMTLNFTANENIESLDGLLSISDELINPGAWHSNQEPIDVDLEIDLLTSINQSVEDFELFQNKPNPFRSNTLIGFNLPEATYGTLSIYDISGRLVYSISENYIVGYNEVAIDHSQLNSNGVFIYQFKTDKYAATKKMTVLE